MLLSLLSDAFADSSFAKLFTEMNPWVIAMFVVGILFCAIEVAMPGFGFFGIGGISLVAIAIVIRMLMGGDALMLLYMVVLATLLFGLLFWLLGGIIRKRQKNTKSMFYVQPAVSDGITQGTKDYTMLLGKIGTTQTILRPIGKAVFDGQPVDVVARDGYVDSGTEIKVVAVEGQIVTVVKV